MRQKIKCCTLNLGIPDEFIEQGSQEEIYQLLQLDSAGIESQITSYFKAS